MEILLLYAIGSLIAMVADRLTALPATLCLDCANAQFVRKAYAGTKTYCTRSAAVKPIKFVVVDCSDYTPRARPAVSKRVCGFGCSGCRN